MKVQSTACKRICNAFGCLLAAASTVTALAQNALTNQPPIIRHEPVTLAQDGQPLTVRAFVSDDSGQIRSVTLFYSTSRDAAPSRVAMENSGAGSFFGTIPPAMLVGGKTIAYYIEALDMNNAATETPWYTIIVRSAGDTSKPSFSSNTATSSAVMAPAQRPLWRHPAVLAGGAALVVGGTVAAIALGGGGGSSGGGGGATTNAYAGLYTGSATTCFALPGAPSSCNTGHITITIDKSGTVRSDDLHPGASMQATLNTDTFVMSTPVSSTNSSGNIRYVGTVYSNGRISGYIEGAATTASGTNGAYSGAFNALRQ